MNEALWTCIATCQVCGREVNRAVHVPERHKPHVELAAPLMGLCPERHHNSLSDVNFGVELEWILEEVAPP